MKLLNLGCGGRYIKGWVNIDFISQSEDVIKHNLLTPLPFEDNSFDAVYNSHVLEHFSKRDAAKFIAEIYRVLKPGGILRVVVPNLERFVTGYLKCLEEVRLNENEMTVANYEWSVIELLDQMVREQSGGEMMAYWSKDWLINEDYVVERLGDEFVSFRKSNYKTKQTQPVATNKTVKSKLKQYFIRKLLKTEISPAELAYLKFRKTGESHKWMYDNVGLKHLLLSQKFIDIKVVNAITSEIKGWENYLSLDIENNKVRKPDSLFIEAKK
jgi:predicted SAM-dependent methyltransferase